MRYNPKNIALYRALENRWAQLEAEGNDFGRILFNLLQEYACHNALHSQFLSSLQSLFTKRSVRHHVGQINRMLNWHTYELSILPHSSLFPLGDDALLHSLFATLFGFPEVKPISITGYIGNVLILLYNKGYISTFEFDAFFKIQAIPVSKNVWGFQSTEHVANPFPDPEDAEYARKSKFTDHIGINEQSLARRISLTLNTESTHLDLRNKYINETYFSALVALLHQRIFVTQRNFPRHTCAITTVNLSRNFIGVMPNNDDKGMRPLFLFFNNYCPSLQRIDLSYNYITAIPKRSLKLLKQNQSLVEINLSNNQLSDQGVCDLLDILKDHKTIERIDLSNNKISNEAYEAMQQFFENKNSACEVIFTIDHVTQSISQSGHRII